MRRIDRWIKIAIFRIDNIIITSVYFSEVCTSGFRKIFRRRWNRRDITGKSAHSGLTASVHTLLCEPLLHLRLSLAGFVHSGYGTSCFDLDELERSDRKTTVETRWNCYIFAGRHCYGGIYAGEGVFVVTGLILPIFFVIAKII